MDNGIYMVHFQGVTLKNNFGYVNSNAVRFYDEHYSYRTKTKPTITVTA